MQVTHNLFNSSNLYDIRFKRFKTTIILLKDNLKISY